MQNQQNQPNRAMLPSHSQVEAQLMEWQAEGLLSNLDIAMARFVAGAFSHPANLNGDDEGWPLRESDGVSDRSSNDESDGLSNEVSSGIYNGKVIGLAAFLSYQVSRGHVCLSLPELLQNPEQTLGLEQAAVERLTISPRTWLGTTSLAQTLAALEQCPAVACVDEGSEVTNQPLVLASGNLYFTRFWRYERTIATQLYARMQSRAFEDIGITKLNTLLEELFPAGPALEDAELSRSGDTEQQRIRNTPWQKLACANTLRGRFSVITGGPGTGKTFTVVRLLALLQRLAMQDSGVPLTIKLAAPTGKAAARLKESIQQALIQLKQAPELAGWVATLDQIDSESATLHKLLGTQQHTRRFRHDAHRPLNLDVLVVDEASMIDIEMMHALLLALPKHAQLILLGDKDQLASVEAGAVLGQLCTHAEQGHYRKQTFDYLQAVSKTVLPNHLFDPEGPEHLQHVVMLRVSRRFDDASGIGHLARAVNNGDTQQLQQLLLGPAMANNYPDIAVLPAATSDNGHDAETVSGLLPLAESSQLDAHEQLWSELKKLCYDGFKGYWQRIQKRPTRAASAADIDAWAGGVLAAYANFQLLSALREGPYGVQGLNQQIAGWLDYIPKQPHPASAPTFLAAQAAHWYEGRPVMVTENDYSLNLRNGDVGVALISPSDNTLRVVFVDSQGQLRWILPSRLRHVQTVFAMTVHKSQGSEFAHTVLVLPPHDSPVLSRELIYTGITRASQRLTLVVPQWHVLGQAVERQTKRAGHLLA